MKLLGLLGAAVESDNESPALKQAGKFLDALKADLQSGETGPGWEFKKTLDALTNLKDPLWSKVGLMERAAVVPMVKMFAKGFSK